MYENPFLELFPPDKMYNASPVPVAFDKAEGHPQNKKQKLSGSVATTTAKGTGANTGQTQKNKNMEDENWDIVRVIPSAEEKLACHTENCDKDAAFSWASNSNRNDSRNFCEGCQVKKGGG